MKLNLVSSSKLEIIINSILAASFLIFFIMNTMIFSEMELIELKLFKIKQHNFFSIFKIEDFNILMRLKKIIYIILYILSGLEFSVLYINIIYLIIHPFIGLKLIFVVNISHYSLILLKIVVQGKRPFWDFEIKKLTEEKECKLDYASPSIPLFFITFLYLYIIINIKKLKKEKFKLLTKFLIFVIHFIIVFFIIAILSSLHDEYFHQLIFSAILGYILICFLLMKDKNIHIYIFKTLKNKYNARRNKIIICFYITGLTIITLILTTFISERKLDLIRRKLKNCNQIKLLGKKESIKDLGYIFGIAGAVWGSTFTLQLKISKWWGKGSRISTSIKKIIIILISNGSFIALKQFLSNSIEHIGLNFILSIIFNFSQNFLTFGVIPLLFEKFGLLQSTEKKNNNSKTPDIEDEQIILFKTSLFREEKENNDDTFVVVNKEVKKVDVNQEKNDETKNDDNNNQLNKNKGEENTEIIYDKKKEGKKEIYENSDLVENVQNFNEEDEDLYLEGIINKNN